MRCMRLTLLVTRLYDFPFLLSDGTRGESECRNWLHLPRYLRNLQVVTSGGASFSHLGCTEHGMPARGTLQTMAHLRIMNDKTVDVPLSRVDRT